MKKISVVIPCYNKKGNVEKLCQRVKERFEKLANYAYKHIFIDNASTDKTTLILGMLAAKDKNIKIILHSRNFGVTRSPYVLRELEKVYRMDKKSYVTIYLYASLMASHP